MTEETELKVVPNYERLIKRHIHSQPQRVILKTAPGLEPITVHEINSFFASQESSRFKSEISVDKDGILIENIGYREIIELLSTLTSVREALWLLKDQTAKDIETFDKVFRSVRWNLIFDRKAPVAIRCDSVGSKLFHETKIKKRAETLAKEAFLAPVEKDLSPNIIEIKLRENKLRISVSLFGKPGYYRGYKTVLNSHASIRQDLASGLICESANWIRSELPDFKPDNIFVPFAGSGTLGFESQIYFSKISPFCFDREFAFNAFKCATQNSFDHLMENIRNGILPQAKCIMIESDPETAKGLQANITSFESKAGKESGQNTCLAEDCFSANLALSGSAFIPLNPPYGVRLKGSPGDHYKKIGVLVNSVAGVVAGFIISPTKTANSSFLKELVGFKSKTSPLNQGGLKVMVTHFCRA